MRWENQSQVWSIRSRQLLSSFSAYCPLLLLANTSFLGSIMSHIGYKSSFYLGGRFHFEKLFTSAVVMIFPDGGGLFQQDKARCHGEEMVPEGLRSSATSLRCWSRSPVEVVYHHQHHTAGTAFLLNCKTGSFKQPENSTSSIISESGELINQIYCVKCCAWRVEKLQVSAHSGGFLMS